MKFFTKKISIFVIFIISAISLNSSAASIYKNIGWLGDHHYNSVFGYEVPSVEEKRSNLINIKKQNLFRNKTEQNSYALGVTIGKYLNHSFQEQEKINIVLNRKFIIQGIIDCINNKVKISNKELKRIITSFELEIQNATTSRIKKESIKNDIAGKKYIARFLKEKNVKRSKTGLLYQIQKLGYGKKILNKYSNVIVVVHYKGKLVDGTMFDSSYSRKMPLYINFQQIIPGWKEALQYIRKGGKIKIVIPPKLGYGYNLIPGIPANSTLIFEIELLDIKESFLKINK
ncbi:FKBP-type peptidyl-prolyl cis-trans isomerase [Enterobacteriaceae endosymbiont of Plateumaris consimilis]|uniref:FKBP-type peptidyl-prolyl cis-trans isomerase n=1 Tax=Enterobacteriaceae endosymbiont of Plateumaris consimilis TaxID=2675794 RepID=UPI00144905AE|nr:FKBP-type peptidyl-prolyl cis-trans isomerase [Enterobacteriaceae endosymbiont of Plateumaris consimilis]QJC28735.1 FKBP-type peptidyl-prolyl cis-trans isomerase [Enterobacteriaceae endosymbiont of Plateumaris consimilis]